MDVSDDETRILATLTPQGPRRWIGVGLQATLGAVLILLAFRMPEGQWIWMGVFGALGVLSVLGASWMIGATEKRIELTRLELREGGGRVLAHVADIKSVDRGAFAFKPSNGFLVILTKPGARAWVPGIWWRMGRFVGVGGVTGAGEGKFMAEMISALIAERDEET